LNHDTSREGGRPLSAKGDTKQRPTPTWHHLDVDLGLSRGDLLNSGASVIFGAIVGWAVSQLFSTPTKVGLWVDLS
jgi:hypothetical protein